MTNRTIISFVKNIFDQQLTDKSMQYASRFFIKESNFILHSRQILFTELNKAALENAVNILTAQHIPYSNILGRKLKKA